MRLPSRPNSGFKKYDDAELHKIFGKLRAYNSQTFNKLMKMNKDQRIRMMSAYQRNRQKGVGSKSPKKRLLSRIPLNIDIDIEDQSDGSFERIDLTGTDIVNTAVTQSPYVPASSEEERGARKGSSPPKSASRNSSTPHVAQDDYNPLVMIKNHEAKQLKMIETFKRNQEDRAGGAASSSSQHHQSSNQGHLVLKSAFNKKSITPALEDTSTRNRSNQFYLTQPDEDSKNRINSDTISLNISKRVTATPGTQVQSSRRTQSR